MTSVCRDYEQHCNLNQETVQEMLKLANDKSLEEEEKMTAEQLEIKNRRQGGPEAAHWGEGRRSDDHQRGAVSRRHARHNSVQMTGFLDLIPFPPNCPRICEWLHSFIVEGELHVQ